MHRCAAGFFQRGGNGDVRDQHRIQPHRRNGPGGGDKRHVGMTLCSRSPYQVDEACAKLMGIAPISAPVIAAARERGFSDGELSLCGDPLEPVSPPFTLPDAILGKEKFFSFNGIFHVFCGRGRTC